MDHTAFLRTMHILERRHPLEDWSATMTPFEVLVSTILSQSTTVANERRGFEGLRRRFGRITPESLADARDGDVARAIWHAGLSHQKAPRIRAVATRVIHEWGGSMDRLLVLPVADAREALMDLPGVGPKTADVVLAMAAARPVLPVDTHIARIARRWGLARSRDGYEGVRGALERWTPPAKRKHWHLALIDHGRELCTARNPRCDACPVARDCDYFHRAAGSARSHGRNRPGAKRQRQKVKNR